jgi:hypothetical protein|eukprot:743-Heterococcus_DN1.PRE.1
MRGDDALLETVLTRRTDLKLRNLRLVSKHYANVGHPQAFKKATRDANTFVHRLRQQQSSSSSSESIHQQLSFIQQVRSEQVL